MDAERQRLLANARREGRAHTNDNGWARLARSLGITKTAVGRVMKGTHHGPGKDANTIRAATVVKYLAASGVSFRDLYGFDPPPRRDPKPTVCPRCSGRKGPDAAVCRDCFEQEGERCTHVKRSGERCRTVTKHASRVCQACRRRAGRPRKPRTGRPSHVTAAMLTLATGAYAEHPSFAWVARRMWATNAAGVREVFKSQQSLAGALVKQFRKHGWSSASDAARAHAQLQERHGEQRWPDPVDPEAAGMVPSGPFAHWLARRHDELGSYKELAARVGLYPDNISKWLRGIAPKAEVRRATVDRALAAWGDGTTFNDLYVKEQQQ